MKTNLDPQANCICGTNIAFEQCCDIYLCGEKPAPTAEALMRSRFTAFAIKDQNYILKTWDPTKQPAKIEFLKETIQWKQLEIIGKKKGGEKDVKGIVEFKAYYLLESHQYRMHEISRFHRSQGYWYYLDGTVKSIAKVDQDTNKGKNAPCPCGSEKKYKRCCGKASF